MKESSPQQTPQPAQSRQEESQSPSTEVAANPNPRANENISDKETTQNNSAVGSEITDGEDA